MDEERSGTDLGRVGVDVGGSAVKAGRVDPDGAVRAERSIPAPADAAELVPAIAGLVRDVAAGGAPGGIAGPVGVGVPGLLDHERGLVAQSPNVPQLERIRLRDELARELGLAPSEVRLVNDADAAALGETWIGAARAERDVLVVTLGTGIGGGLVLGGELFRGEGGHAGEIGHVRIEPGGPPCGCGGRGCLETLASATAARRRARERGLPAEAPWDLELLAERARSGAEPEARLLREVGRDLGRGLAVAVCLLDLRAFVIGGGFSAALDGLLPGIRAGIREGAWGERVEAVRVARAALGASAGWIGAARLAFDGVS